MTYGELKRQVFARLDLDFDRPAEPGSLRETADVLLIRLLPAMLRKTAMLSGCIQRSAELCFTREGNAVCAVLPDDVLAVQEIFASGRRYRMPSFETVGRKLFFFEAEAGSYEVIYAACPEIPDAGTPDETELEIDDYTADIVVCGVAGELAQSLYPGDMTRYMRLMTEYDERILHLTPRTGERGVADTVFGRGRGNFR